MFPTIPRPDGSSIGAVLDLARDPLEVMPEFARAYGDIYALPFPLLPTVVIHHPTDVRHVLVVDHACYRKDFLTRQLEDALGTGLLTSDGAVWKRHRRLAQPAFHGRAIRGYASTMVSLADAAAAGWGAQTTVDVHRQMMELTLQIVARTLFGHDIGDAGARVGHALDVFMEVYMGLGGSGLRVPAWLPTPGNRRARRVIADLDALVYGIIEAHRRDARDEDTLLGMLLAATDEGGGLTDVELRDECITLLLAGHETTANALTYCLYLLARHPEAERRLLAELDAVCPDGPPTVDDVGSLPYTRAVVLESMRLYPPAWAIAREAVVDTTIAGHRIPRGTQVWMSQWCVHRDGRWFVDPLAFLPERWLDGGEAAVHDGAYFPFAAGPRACIGKRFAELEAVIVLATLYRRVTARLAPGEQLELQPSVTLRPTHGLRMVITARGRP